MHPTRSPQPVVRITLLVVVGCVALACSPRLGGDVTAPRMAVAPALTESPAGSGQTYFEFQVEQPVRIAVNSAAPRYPSILRQAAVEGEVLAAFIVDTTGLADEGSFKVLKTTHELFAASVRNALPNMRFTPAMVRGRKVRQLVQEPFVFALGAGAQVQTGGLEYPGRLPAKVVKPDTLSAAARIKR